MLFSAFVSEQSDADMCVLQVIEPVANLGGTRKTFPLLLNLNGVWRDPLIELQYRSSVFPGKRYIIVCVPNNVTLSSIKSFKLLISCP